VEDKFGSYARTCPENIWLYEFAAGRKHRSSPFANAFGYGKVPPGESKQSIHRK
jgi:hypothetical protein